MRNFLVAVGVFGSLGLAGSALAKPWDRENASPPPGAFRSEIQLRGSVDGRADLHADRASRPDPYSMETAKPAPDRDVGQAKAPPPVQFKAEITMRMQHGDNREGGSASQVSSTAAQRPTVDNSFGRQAKPAPIPLKSEVALRLQGEGNRDDGSASKRDAADKRDRNSKEQHLTVKHVGSNANAPLSPDEKTALCKHTGVCVPVYLESDDVSDKTM